MTLPDGPKIRAGIWCILGSMLPLYMLLACTALNLYLLGAATLLGRVSYPLMAEAGRAALPVLHTALNRRLGLVFIAPEFLAFLAVLPLFWLRPARVAIGSVWLCVALGVAYFVVTFGWHLPAHKLLDGDTSDQAMRTLLVSHAVRTILVALKCGLLLWMLARALDRGQ